MPLTNQYNLRGKPVGGVVRRFHHIGFSATCAAPFLTLSSSKYQKRPTSPSGLSLLSKDASIVYAVTKQTRSAL